MRIDGCLDRGGAFDYSNDSCSTSPNGPQAFPVISYGDRHGRFFASTLSSGIALALLGAAFVRGAGRRPERSA